MSVKSGSITFNIYTDRDNSLALSDLKLFYTELSDNDIKELNDNIIYIVQYMKLTKNVKEKYTSVLGLYLEFYNLQADNTLGDLEVEHNKIYVLIDGDQITITLKYKQSALKASKYAAISNTGKKQSTETQIKKRETFYKNYEKNILAFSKPHRQYHINGKIYNGHNEVFVDYQISSYLLNKRIKSNDYPDWVKIK
jgi:hypothetical protein